MKTKLHLFLRNLNLKLRYFIFIELYYNLMKYKLFFFLQLVFKKKNVGF